MTTYENVIDVGCATWGGDQSVGPLIDEFHPRLLLGFDPELPNKTDTYEIGDTRVILSRKVAWLHSGGVEFASAGLGSHVEEGHKRVDSIDLREVVKGLTGSIVLKLDCEMSEYDLLPALIAEDLDERVGLLLIEWHCPWCRHGEWSHSHLCDRGGQPNERRDMIEAQWRGEMREWDR